MAKLRTARGSRRTLATAEDLRAILGELDEAKVMEILALRPTIADLEEAAVWSVGNGDILGKQGKPLTGVAARVCDIVMRDEWQEER